MSDFSSAAAPAPLRQWVENWRLVNAKQDALIRSASSPNPAACLEAALSLIAFARSLDPDSRLPNTREAEDEAVRRTWQYLRADYIR